MPRLATSRFACFVSAGLLLAPLLVACAGSRLHVESTPPDAAVTLQLVYERETGTHVGPFMHRNREQPQVTEEIPLGLTPVSYRFRRSKTESAVNVGGLAGQRVQRHYIEGILRVHKEGYLPVEQRFPVRRGTTYFDVELEPVGGSQQ